MKPSRRKKTTLRTDELRMQFVIRLARRNVQRNSGGPFGAAVFDLKTGRLLGSGVNRVVSKNDPTAHGEMTALREACRKAKTYSLKAGKIEAGLYASAEPCGMCCTAILWAGIQAVFCAAATSDVEAIGFDEGLKPDDWARSLSRRGVSVTKGLLRDEAVLVLKEYRRKGGRIYNG